MLTLPSVHPFLMTLLMDGQPEREQLAAIPHLSWKTIIQEAIAQRIAAMLFRWLNHSSYRHCIPIHLLNPLNQHMVRQAAWNLLLTKELRRVLDACQQRGIGCIPIRGPVFAAQLYGDSSMRQMDDLDLLVHREDLPLIKEIFHQLGYAQHEQRPGFLEAFSYSLEFIHPSHGLIVEPHWTLAYPPFAATTTMAPVWERTVRQRLMDMDIDTWTLSHADILLHLCLHLLHKGEHSPLLWHYEVNRLIRQNRSTLDWNIFVHQAQAMGQASLIADVLATSLHRFNSSLPDSVMSRLLRHSRPSLPTRSRENHMLTQSSLNGREEFALLCSLQGLRSKILYSYALLFPSSQYMVRRYGVSGPIGLISCYITRVCHLFWQGCKWATAWLVAALATRQG